MFHGHALRGVRRGLRAARRADARRPREEVRAVQLGRRGRRERGEDRPRVHQAHRRRRLRPRLPRPHEPHHGHDGEEHAVQAGLRSVRPEVYRVPVAYGYRWPTGAENAGAEASAQAIDAITKQIGADNVAAIIIEPVLGEGGFIEPAKGFLPAIAQFAKDNGIVFVADEIQSGFCRTGQWFACEDEGVVPDLITTAKGIAGGLPLSAVTGRAEIMDAAHAGGLGGTYGGNPVACAGALGAIETMRELDLNGRAKRIEEVMKGRLAEMQAKLPNGDIIGDIRGRGAMIAIELVKSGTKDPNPEVAGALAKACHAEGCSSSPAARTATSCASCRRW